MTTIDTRTIIDAEQLRRSISGLDIGPFTVRLDVGEIVALVGQNGSGKTTCLRLMLGLDRASEGTCVIAGRPVSPIHPPLSVGYVPDHPAFWDWCSGAQNLLPFSSDDRRVQQALATVGLQRAGRTAVKNYSRGMRQRLAIARALIGEPDVLVLDEPTIAMDAQGIDLLIGLLRARRSEGLSALVATHDDAFLGSLDARVITVEQGRTLS